MVEMDRDNQNKARNGNFNRNCASDPRENVAAVPKPMCYF